MELIIALLTGATAAMIAAGLWLSPRLGWLLHAAVGAVGGAVAGHLLSLTPATGGDAAYILRLITATGLCGAAALWALGAATRLLRR